MQTCIIIHTKHSLTWNTNYHLCGRVPTQTPFTVGYLSIKPVNDQGLLMLTTTDEYVSWWWSNIRDVKIPNEADWYRVVWVIECVKTLLLLYWCCGDSCQTAHRLESMIISHFESLKLYLCCNMKFVVNDLIIVTYHRYINDVCRIMNINSIGCCKLSTYRGFQDSFSWCRCVILNTMY